MRRNGSTQFNSIQLSSVSVDLDEILKMVWKAKGMQKKILMVGILDENDSTAGSLTKLTGAVGCRLVGFCPLS